MILGIFKIALCLRDQHAFMWQSLGILTYFNAWTLKQILWKKKIFFKNLKYRFVVQSSKIKTQHFYTKPPCQKPMFRQIEWGVQNEPIAKNGVLTITT